MATTISLNEFFALLAIRKGAQFVTFTARVEPEVIASNPYVGVRKISRVNATVNWNYGAAVNRQREREGNEPDFVPHKRKWGTRLEGLPFVSHKGKLYLEAKPEKVLSTKYEWCGVELSPESIKPYLKEKASNKAHQGVQKEIFCRDYTVENIEEITIGGETYKIAA